MAQDTYSKVAATLRKTPLFAPLNESELQSLALRAALKAYSTGELLFSEGEVCTGLYVVISGRVRIFKSFRTGREQVLAIEGAPESIAELPVFDGGNYPASAVALESSEMAFISHRSSSHSALQLSSYLASSASDLLGFDIFPGGRYFHHTDAERKGTEDPEVAGNWSTRGFDNRRVREFVR